MTYPTDRKSPVRLTDAEEFTVYKYCIENHCVYQVEAAIEWRVNREKIAKEINLLNYFKGRTISSHHVTSAVERVVSWQKVLDKIPVVPMETAELEQLRIYKTKTMKEVEEFKTKIEHCYKLMAQQAKEIERLKEPSDAQNKLERIRAIVSV